MNRLCPVEEALGSSMAGTRIRCMRRSVTGVVALLSRRPAASPFRTASEGAATVLSDL